MLFTIYDHNFRSIILCNFYLLCLILFIPTPLFLETGYSFSSIIDSFFKSLFFSASAFYYFYYKEQKLLIFGFSFNFFLSLFSKALLSILHPQPFVLSIHFI